MLRRRKKTPKFQPHATPGPRTASPTRRRARPDAAVPPELLIREESARKPPPARSRGGDGVVLVTGFEPFGGERSNPSWDVVERLPAAIAGMRVQKCKVPCEFRRAIEVVAGAIERHRPALVVCLGQAGGRSRVAVERVAINVDDARAPDNAGARPIDEAIAENGPPAYFATLPVKAMVAAMRSAGVPAELSNTAGTYVCNHLMYGVLHFIAASGHAARAGFVHVPYSEAQVIDKAGAAGMALDTMARGIEAGIAAAAAHARDIKVSEGTLD
jgi:pyroglutamyl-peptidase